MPILIRQIQNNLQIVILPLVAFANNASGVAEELVHRDNYLYCNVVLFNGVNGEN